MKSSEADRGLTTDAFDYPLDEDLVAQRPLDDRDASRLLAVRKDEGRLEDLEFRQLPDLLSPGDVLVVNDTRVFPARLLGRKPTGARAEILLVRPLDPARSRWEAIVRPGGKLKPGRTVEIADELTVSIEDSTATGGRIVRLETSLPVETALSRFGHVPLPPYIRREDDVEDRTRYQTVYAEEVGSVAAPTAGLHFSERLLARIEARGVTVAAITLHVGPGTFRPVEAGDPADHRLDREWYRVPTSVAEMINEARAAGGAVWAVGTTAVRALETVADTEGVIEGSDGWTDLFIRPGHEFRVVERLITNFHLPRSPLLMLVAAFAGHELTMAAYRHAREHRYRFYSYGDAMVVL